ncbi:MAG: extracellular solute-binding protein [Eubacterium sp.]|nr:extracellular solute-binding protein [Eubacterium sp.]
MKMKMKYLKMAAVTGLAAALIAGCGSSGDSNGSSSEGGTTTITFMNHTGEDKTKAYEDELIAAFEEANQDIKVEVQRMSMDDYTQTIQTKIASGDAPDVFYIEQSNLDKYAGSDYLLDLTDTSIAEHYDGNMLVYEGKSYGAPLGVNTYIITYNKSVFADLNIEIPQTTTEFYDACETIKGAGLVPLVAGYQDTWVLMADTQAEYVNDVMLRDADALKKLESREVRFSESADWKAVFERFAKRMQYTQGDQFGTDWNTACTMLANGDAAMIVSGDWTANNVADMGEDVELGAFILPVSDNADEVKMAVPGAGQSYAISADSENQAAAVKFVDFMTSKEAGEKYVAESIGVCVIKDVETPEVESALADIVAYMNEGKSEFLSADFDANFTEEYRDAFQNTVSSFILDGAEDVDKLLQDLDTEFDRIHG